MNLTGLMKQLRRRLRSKKRWLTLGAFLLAAGIAAGIRMYAGASAQVDAVPVQASAMGERKSPAAEMPRERKEALEAIASGAAERSVAVQKIFVCGEELQQLGAIGKSDIMKLSGEHPLWEITILADGGVRFVERIDDLSPKCKETAYFGIDKNGNLSLFEGTPGEEQVIRTFFQLNVEYLKSSLPQESVKQLYEGIRISDLADYNSVLSTFSDFAVEAVKERSAQPKV